MSTIRSFRDLEIWQLANQLFEMIVQDVKKFPNERVAWIIADQVIRSIGSISANIAEGSGRGGKKN